MPRNHLKSFPTAMLRRGMAHFHPGASSPGPNLAAREWLALARVPAATPAAPAPAAVEPVEPAPAAVAPTTPGLCR
jgi:hypothetical protein